MEGDRIGFEVSYEDKIQIFTAEQILAMIFVKVKEIANHHAGRVCKRNDCVISVPPYYTDSQRRAMFDACSIANLNCLRLINENTSAGLAYGIYRNHKGLFSDKEAQYVMFVDMGEASAYASIIAFIQGKLQVMSCAYDRMLGGRNLDDIIVELLSEGFKEKYKLDPMTTPKSLMKLRAAAETCKKVLNPDGVTKTPVNIECLMEERDYNCQIEKATFFRLIEEKGYPARLSELVTKALADANLKPEQIMSCEIIGGSMRVAPMKEAVAKVLGFDLKAQNYGLSTTMNMDECIATGSAWLSAILSPLYRVKDFKIGDIVQYPIRLSWDKEASGSDKPEDNSNLSFDKCAKTPAYRKITLKPKGTFTISCDYDDAADTLAEGTTKNIGKFIIKELPEMKTDPAPPAIVYFGYDPNGLCYCTNAQITVKEEKEFEEEVPDPNAVETPKETEDKKEGEEKKEEEKREPEPTTEAAKEGETTPKEGEAEAPKEAEEKKEETTTPKKPKTIKKIIKKVVDVNKQLEVEANVQCLPKDILKKYTEEEKRMYAQDCDIRETQDKRNELETYLYDMRDKIDVSLAGFCAVEEKYKLKDLIEKHSKWIDSDEGFGSNKNEFIKRIKELHKISDPVVKRQIESEKRPQVSSDLLAMAEKYLRLCNSTDEQYSHITDEEKTKVRDACNEVQKWLSDNMSTISSSPMYVDPVITVEDIIMRTNNTEKLCREIMERPKPKPKAAKKEEKKDDKKDAPATPKEGETTPKEGGETPKEEAEKPKE